MGNDDGTQTGWTVRAAGKSLGLVGPSRPFSGKKLSFSVGLDEVDVFMTHAESIFKVDSRLVRECHAGLEEYFCVPFVEIRRLVGYKVLVISASTVEMQEGYTDL